MGKNWAGPFFPHPNKIKHEPYADGYLGGRKTQLVHYFPTLTSKSNNLTLSWIHIQPLLFSGWGKTGPAHSFLTLTSESNNPVQKLGYLGGEKLGRPILSPVKTSTIPCHEYANNLGFLRGGEKLGRPVLSPPRQDKASTLCRWLPGWRKARLVHCCPTLTSESINLTLSWIHIQSLLIRGLIRGLLLSVWRKSGPAQFFPSPSTKYNWCWKIWGGEKTWPGGEKTDWLFFSPGEKND